MRAKLTLMMFGQYFVWGAWWVTLGTYMNAIGFDAFIAQVYSVQGWAAIIAPLIFGIIADKYLSAHIIFAVLHLLAGGLLFVLAGVQSEPSTFFLVALGVMMFYMPTIALSNTIAFGALTDVQKQFPAIRVFGTIGWIVAGLIIGFQGWEPTQYPILLAAGASLALGAFGFFLPATPPNQEKTTETSLMARTGLDMFKIIRDRSFWIFIVASLLICIPLSFYYSYTNTFLVESGVERAAAIQSLGQVSEILFLIALPFFMVRFGIKWVLVVGMAAWTVRYIAFAFGGGEEANIALLVFGIVLHGICYDFFFVAGQIYADNTVEKALRARVQAFLSLVTLGVGTVLGTTLAGAIYNANTIDASTHNWETIWLIPAALAFIVAVGFAFVFKGARASRRTEALSNSA